MSGLFCLSANEGVFVYIEGEVEIKIPGQSDFKPAEIGMAVAAGSVICTGFNSVAEIDIKTGVIAAGPLTRMTLDQLVVNRKTAATRLSLSSGSVEASVVSSVWEDNDFQVSTPVTTVSVRGTRFTATIRGVECSEGRVIFSKNNRGGSVLLSAGQSSESVGSALLKPRTARALAVSPSVASPASLLAGTGRQALAACSSKGSFSDDRSFRYSPGDPPGSVLLAVE